MIDHRPSVITMIEYCGPIARSHHHEDVAIRVAQPTAEKIRFCEEQGIWVNQVSG